MVVVTETGRILGVIFTTSMNVNTPMGKIVP